MSVAGFTDETPRDYHCNLGPDGRRRDADERPELCRGTVEFIATKEYMVSIDETVWDLSDCPLCGGWIFWIEIWTFYGAHIWQDEMHTFTRYIQTAY